MSRNIGIAVVLVLVIALMITGSATTLLSYLQSWLNADHTVSGLVLVLGAVVIIIGTKVLWR